MSERRIHFRGNATGFFHHLGRCIFLRHHYDLSQVKFSGCSSGAIMASIMTLNIDFIKVVIRPFQLQPKGQNRFALTGSWKKKMRLFFEEILADNYNYNELTRLRIGVQFMDGFQFFENFSSKEDLMNCLLASTHIPFFMDFKPFEKFRGRVCLDGDLFSAYERIKEEGVFYLNYEIPFLEAVSLKSENDLIQLIKKGYQEAKNNTELHSYLKEYQQTSHSEQYLFDFLRTLKTSLVKVYNCELEQSILNDEFV